MKAFVSNLLITALALAQDTSAESNAVWDYSQALVSHELALTSYCGMAEY
jgi:hypothetical protein